MAKEYSRTERIGDFLQQELAKLIQSSLRDPRLQMVSITGVDVSRDLAHARVYFTQLGVDDPAAATKTALALEKAGGFLRSEIARHSSLRTIPKMRFVFDESVGRGREMEALIRDARASDQRHADGPVDDEAD